MPGAGTGGSNITTVNAITDLENSNPVINKTQEEPVATTIVWSDASTSEEVTNNEPPIELKNEVINGVTKDQVSDAIGNQLDKKTKATVSSLFGDSTGLADVIAKLDAGIEKQESKRDAMKLMMFGLGMLSGGGVQQSIAAANAVGSFNKQRIDELYDQRKTIQDRVTKEALGQTFGEEETKGPSEFGTGYRGSDGNVYFNPNNVPAGVDITNKVGTEDEGDLPSKLQGSVDRLDTTIDESYNKVAKIQNVVDSLDKTGGAFSSGVFGQGGEWMKKFFGTQDEVSTFRTLVNNLTLGEAISNRPPGPASDKDIALLREGVANGFTNEAGLRDWMAAIERLSNYERRYAEAKRDYIYDNRSSRGFKAPAYEPSGSDAASNNTTGVLDSSTKTSNGGGVKVDLDLSNLGG